MSKLFSIISVLVIILMLLLPNFVQATDVNMNLTNNLDTSNVEDTNTSDTTTVPQSYSSSGDIVSNLNSLPEAELGLTNILSIILIVVGVLLILLAIAILIRLKH